MNNCCNNPRTVDLMYGRGDTINALCLTCKTHWYGPRHNPTEYTPKQWGDWINSEDE